MDVFAVHFVEGLLEVRHPVRSDRDLHRGSVRAMVQFLAAELVRKLSHPVLVDPPIVEVTPLGSDGRVEDVHGKASQARRGSHVPQLLEAETEEIVRIEAGSSIFRLCDVPGLRERFIVKSVCADVGLLTATSSTLSTSPSTVGSLPKSSMGSSA